MSTMFLVPNSKIEPSLITNLLRRVLRFGGSSLYKTKPTQYQACTGRGSTDLAQAHCSGLSVILAEQPRPVKVSSLLRTIHQQALEVVQCPLKTQYTFVNAMNDFSTDWHERETSKAIGFSLM